jgi:hypothetical protein
MLQYTQNLFEHDRIRKQAKQKLLIFEKVSIRQNKINFFLNYITGIWN